MFGLFRRKQKVAIDPPQLSESEKQALVKELEKAADDELTPVEEALVLVRPGATPEALTGLFARLEHATIGILAKDPQDLETMLVLKDSSGESAIAVFTSLVRTTPVTARFPEHTFFLQLEIRGLVQGINNIGISINPFDEAVRFYMTAEMVEILKRIISKPA